MSIVLLEGSCRCYVLYYVDKTKTIYVYRITIPKTQNSKHKTIALHSLPITLLSIFHAPKTNIHKTKTQKKRQTQYTQSHNIRRCSIRKRQNTPRRWIHSTRSYIHLQIRNPTPNRKTGTPPTNHPRRTKHQRRPIFRSWGEIHPGTPSSRLFPFTKTENAWPTCSTSRSRPVTGL